MTRFDDLDRALAAYFERDATTTLVPDGLLDETMAITAGRSPRWRWHAWLSAERATGIRPALPVGRSLAIAFALLALLVALLAIGLNGGAPRPALRVEVVPSASASALAVPPNAATSTAPAQPSGAIHAVGSFSRSFEYRDVPLAPLAPVGASSSMAAFATAGSDPYPPVSEDGTWPSGEWGITFSSARDAVTHPCPLVNGGSSRVPVNGRDARLFLEDLRTIAGVDISEPVETTFDNRPAIVAMVDPSASRCDAADFHVSGSGVGGGWVQLGLPSRLIVVDVNGMPIVVQVWASSASDLGSVLPAASAFLDGVHFTP